LLDYYGLIESADQNPRTRVVPYRAQIKNLNAARTSIKHQGVLPDTTSLKQLPAIVSELLGDLCRVYLAVELESLSLVALIRNDTVRAWISRAEEKHETEDYEQALICLGYAMYHLAEFGTTGGLLGVLMAQPRKKLEFTKPYGTDFTVELLEHGVDPFTYHRFRDLTPRMAYDTEESQVVYEWDKNYGHAKNWTRTNSRFCIEFCVDCALRFETRPAYAYDIVPYGDAYEDVIEPLGDEAVFYNCAERSGGLFTGKPATRVPVFVLKRGQRVVGTAMDASAEDDGKEWLVRSDDIPSSETWSGRIACVKKDAVQVISRERSGPLASREAESSDRSADST
jgi:hypothetical protein